MSDSGIATDLVLEVFRANGLLLAAGDGIAGREGLTSARWQVLGAVALAGQAITVPQIGRRMGLTRQSVQATMNRLVDEDMLRAEPNDQHRRSPRFALTVRGDAAYARLSADQERWIGALTEGIAPGDLEVAARVLADISGRLAAPDDTRGSHEVP